MLAVSTRSYSKSFDLLYYYNICLRLLLIILHTIGIDLEQYRIRIGIACSVRVKQNEGKRLDDEVSISIDTLIIFIYFIILVYLLPFLFNMHISAAYNSKLKPKFAEYFF